ncbi:MAG: ABC transporter ATP-binding protein [Brevinematales bacterium]|nr:ABC transporter ATP-binding protein [Brevinematales bacterium]
MKELLIKLENIKKIYNSGSEEAKVYALKGINLEVKKGEFIAIMGASGSGKSTLMNIIGFLDIPTEGSYYLEGDRVDTFSKDELAEIRNKKLGFVFQSFNLLSRTSAFDNVKLPLLYSKPRLKESEISRRVINALEMVGLKERKNHLPNQLSGGEQQRVAIARALVNNPSIILADEPTGNLDSKRSKEIMNIFTELNKYGITIILVTHEHDIAEYAKRVIEMRDGNILKDSGGE